MPPLPGAAKRKHKDREARRSRSRNTTPSSVISSSTVAPIATHTPWLDLETAKLMVAGHPQYSDILDQLEVKPSNLEPRRLQEVIDQLKKLSDSAEKRVESCEKAIRLIHEQMRDIEADHKERERQVEQARRTKAKKEESQGKAKKRKERPESTDVDIKKEGKFPAYHLIVAHQLLHHLSCLHAHSIHSLPYIG
jgi:transcriptional adapter 3